MKTLVKLLGLVGIVATAILVDRARRKPHPALLRPRHIHHDIVDADIIAEIERGPL